MNYERYNLSQLSKVTKTNARTLYEWIRLGYLRPCQIAGTRRKYSIENFLAAEKMALKHAERLEAIRFFEAEEKLKQQGAKNIIVLPDKKKIKKVKKIPDYFFDHLEEFLY